MRNDHYPQGTVQALLLTDAVTSNTRIALQNRLKKEHVIEPRFFDAETFSTLQAVCMQLIPQHEPERMADLAGGLDDILAEGKGNGWRYDAMPADDKAFSTGLKGINKTAVLVFNKSFILLSTKEQNEILTSVQTGATTGDIWQIIPPKLFFEELLGALAELYYSHPFAKEDIGEVAMADANGWQKVGLNELEAHEPQLVKEEAYVKQ